MVSDTIYTLDIPAGDSTLSRSLVKRFGWKAKKQKQQRITRLDAAIKAAHEDELFETNDIETLMKSLTE